MAKSPAVLWYTGDYLVGIIGMTFEEQGRYTYLLNLQHQRGHLNIAEIMPDCPQVVLSKFKQDDDGLYYNERMETEITKREKFVESRRRNATKKEPEENTDTTKAYAEHMENENINNINNINNTTNPPTPLSDERADIAGDTVKMIVGYLNDKAGTLYKSTARNTIAKIQARFNEGYTVDDFFRVIDNKCADWIGTDYQKFLRPETLFGPKFESYLNQRKARRDTFFDLLEDMQ